MNWFLSSEPSLSLLLLVQVLLQLVQKVKSVEVVIRTNTEKRTEHIAWHYTSVYI